MSDADGDDDEHVITYLIENAIRADANSIEFRVDELPKSRNTNLICRVVLDRSSIDRRLTHPLTQELC